MSFAIANRAEQLIEICNMDYNTGAIFVKGKNKKLKYCIVAERGPGLHIHPLHT